ncbi:MAG: energy transducer TonB [Pseudomonadota bacterium]
MKSQVKAFQLSFLLHGVLFAAVLILSSQIGPSKKFTALDFNLYKPQPAIKKIEPPVPAPVRKEIKPQDPPALKKNEPPKPEEEKPERAPAPEISPVIKLPESQSLGGPSLGLGRVPSSKSIKEGSPGSAAGIKGGSGTSLGGGGSSDIGKDFAKNKYLKEHFTYIRDKILGHISYPSLARRMGWQGKVLVSFIITADGSVREVRVIQSSGFAILDKNALEAVKETAPFPKPPVEAQLVIPILYRLD